MKTAVKMETMCFVIVCYSHDLRVELQRHEKCVAPLAGMSQSHCGSVAAPRSEMEILCKKCVCLEAILFPYTSAQTTAGQSLKTWAYGGCIDCSMIDFDKPEWPTTASLQGEVCKFCPTTSATSPPNATAKLMIDFNQVSPSLSIIVQTN